MRILVIDDSACNQKSALETLDGHEVTVCGTIEEAMKSLGDKDLAAKFDAVLTDLFMPIGWFRGLMSRGISTPEGELPAGLVFAIRAVNCGIRSVICTDSDHHQDWICTLLDLVGNGIQGEKGPNRRVSYVEARCVQAGIVTTPDGDRCVKHWGKAMKLSGLFPELASNRRD